jgi:hypothetical protein
MPADGANDAEKELFTKTIAKKIRLSAIMLLIAWKSHQRNQRRLRAISLSSQKFVKPQK